MTPRDEEAIICRQIELTLAGVTHTVNVRSIRENRVLRRRLIEMFDQPPGADNIDAALDFQETLMDLPEMYAPEIKDACASATDEEMIEAGRMVYDLVFPFVRQLAKTMTQLAEKVQAANLE